MRRGLVILGAVLAVALLAWQLGRGVRLPLFDFVEYWAAGRLLIEGRNPYNLEAIQEAEREALRNREAKAVPMLNPPWTLPFVLPLAAFEVVDVHTAHLLWLLVQFTALALSTDLLWRYFGGAAERRWVSWLIACTFLPSCAALTAGQISPLILLGAVLFLYALRAGRPVLAGAATLLLAIKPHLVLLFFVVLVFDEIRRRRLTLLAMGAATGLAAAGIALAFDPAVLQEYWESMTTRPPSGYSSPTFGTVLRLLFGEEQFAWQFVPPLLGMAWAVPYWWGRRHDWRWEARLPLVLLVSMLTAAYGAWLFDLVILLIPVLQIAARTPRRHAALALHLLINGLAAVELAFAVEFLGFLWMTPALLLGYLALKGADGQASSPVL